jgi:ribosomal protein L11 methyltransferase
VTNESYTQLLLHLGEEQFDAAVGLLAAEGYESFLEDGDTLQVFIPTRLWTSNKQSDLDALLKTFTGKPVSVKALTIEPQNWNAEWEATLNPIEISEKLIIVQHGKEFSKKVGQHAIEINPKMSFGTGYHETTRLMLLLLAEVIAPDDLIIDIGTGTGVLAIAARKLGNLNPILATDNDEWSIENTKENIAINQAMNIDAILNDAESGLAPLLGSKPFTLILANINRAVHDKILPLIALHGPDSKVLISGILKYDETWLNALLAQIHFKLDRRMQEGDWLCGLISKA